MISTDIRTIWNGLKDPSRKTFENDPNVSALSDLLLSLINGKRTLDKTQLAITIHGLTRNKELVQLLHKFGLLIMIQLI